MNQSRGGGGGECVYHEFPSKICCLTVPKNSIEKPSSVPKAFGIEKFYAKDGGGREYHAFPSKTCCLTVS